MAGRRRFIETQYLYGNDWLELENKFPEAAEFLWLCAAHNKLRRAESYNRALKKKGLSAETSAYNTEKLNRELLEHAKSEYRWDHRFL